MGQPIHCDWPECPNPGAYLLSRMVDGDTQSYCDGHLVEFMRGVVATVDAAAAGPEPEAEPAAEPQPQPRRARRAPHAADESMPAPEPIVAPGPSTAATDDVTE